MTAVMDAIYDYAAQPTEAVLGCPVCGTPQISRPAYDRYGFLIGLSHCGCGLVYLNPRLTRAGYAAFYREAYRPLVEAFTPARDLPIEATARGHAIAASLSPKPRTILDVGGGTGLVGAAAGAVCGAAVTVLDPNAEELAQARARGCETWQGLVETSPQLSARFDLILCVKTADHWLDPLAALRWMRSALAPEGQLWIDIVDSGEWRKAAPLDTWKIDHPLYWTPRSFERALDQTGWAVQSRRWPMTGQGQIERRRLTYVCVKKEGA